MLTNTNIKAVLVINNTIWTYTEDLKKHLAAL